MVKNENFVEGGGIKENDEGGVFIYNIFIVRTSVNVTMYSLHNNKRECTKKERKIILDIKKKSEDFLTYFYLIKNKCLHKNNYVHV
jgi:hypothetical protein